MSTVKRTKPELTTDQRRRVDRAREAAAKSMQDLAPDGMDAAVAAGYAFGVAQTHIGFLLEVIDELTNGGAR